jgi:hypothetical protein
MNKRALCLQIESQRPRRFGPWRSLIVMVLALVTGCNHPPHDGRASASADQPVDEQACLELEYEKNTIMGGPFDVSCRFATDCVQVWATNCGRDCPRALSRAGASAHAAAVELANRGPCKGFKEAGCVMAQPSCVVRDPVCEDGSCKIR